VAGALPTVWNVEPRNPAFAGREPTLLHLHQQLHDSNTGRIHTLRGVGGAGKTQIAKEYAYRFARDYEIVWWINAEDPSLIGEQVATLATQLELVSVSADISAAAASAMRYLRHHNRWLLIFDNAEDKSSIWQWLPSGPGHVLITSRSGSWGQIPSSVTAVDVMERAESVVLLRNHYRHLSEEGATKLAVALGDLPLALAQAGNFLAETGTSVDDYLRLLTTHPGNLLGEGTTDHYPRSLAAAISLSIGRLEEVDQTALALVRMCAFMAPEAIPIDWLTTAPDPTSISRDGPLAKLLNADKDPVALHRSVRHLSRLGLATIAGEGVRLHRLTQAVIRDEIPITDRGRINDAIQAIVAMKNPGDPDDADTWHHWAKLLPHLVALDSTNSKHMALRSLTVEASWYLVVRGDAHAGGQLALRLYQNWRADLGPDHPLTLRAATTFARAQRDEGQYTRARQLDEDSLSRYQRVLGVDHTATLESAHNLAITLRELGELARAHHLQEDTLARRQRVLGIDHPDTLYTKHDLAVTLRESAQFELARSLLEDTLTRQRSVFGDNHPATLRSAHNLAITLRELGKLPQARHLLQETLTRRQYILGDNHPDVLRSAHQLAITLRELGEFAQARQLHEDTLASQRPILGDDHPATLDSAHNLAITLHELGELDRSRQLLEDTLRRRRRVLGDMHPATLRSETLARRYEALR